MTPLAIRSAINEALDREEDVLLANLTSRAEVLAWAIEGAMRLSPRKRPHEDNKIILSELGRQPGIAWLAVTSPDGKILYDSNPALAGLHLYSQTEMELLAPDNSLQGRFSPDDPAIYEFWKLFSPYRLRRTPSHEPIRQDALFMAFDATHMNKALSQYQQRLWLSASFLALTLGALGCLAFYILRYRASRRGLQSAIDFTCQIIDASPEGLLVVSPSGRIILYNKKFRQLFHITERAPMALQNLPGYDWQDVMETVIDRSHINRQEGELALPKSAPIPFDLSACSITTSAGRVLGYLITIRDLAEVEHLKRKLSEARRLGTLSNIASGLAHEIRNPLSSIRGYASYLASRLNNDLIGKRSADLLVEETERLNRVLDDLLHIARPRALAPSEMDLVQLIAKAVAIVRPDAESAGVKIHIAAPAAAPAYLDANALLQAILNLLLNAIQHLPANGEITISLAKLAPDSPCLPLELPKKATWELKIKDNGAGIPTDVMKDIFTPYFTTRPNGTGLGLPIARQIISSHGGALKVASVPGRETTFTIFLPTKADDGTGQDTCGR